MGVVEARRFIAGKYFAYSCFDGTSGDGKFMQMARSRATSKTAAPDHAALWRCLPAHCASAARNIARRCLAFRLSPALLSSARAATAFAAPYPAWPLPIVISSAAAGDQPISIRLRNAVEIGLDPW